MNKLKLYSTRFSLAVGLLLSLGLNSGHSAEKPLKLIELFTSHGCSSCPPAEELVVKLQAADDELVLIEYHVDYWNSLVHGGDGNFVDPFSKSAYSDRQRLYNRVGLRGRPGVYTPQAVINGRIAAVGSDKRRIKKALKKETKSVMAIDIAVKDEQTLTVSVSGSESERALADGAEVLLVSIIKKTVTEITGGENRHKTLTNHHVATDVKRLGRVSAGADLTYSIARPQAEMSCVVLVQHVGLNPVYAAVSCP